MVPAPGRKVYLYDDIPVPVSQITTNSKKEETASKKRSLSPDDSKSKLCDGCGRSGHASATCHFKNSKYFNTGGGTYIDSKTGSDNPRDG